MPFTEQEIAQLRASDAAEDGRRSTNPVSARSSWRNALLPDRPPVTVTVGESIAALSDEDRNWMLEQGYIVAA